MININDFYLTTNKVMLGETLATQYIWTDENGNKVAEFKIWDWWDGINISDLEICEDYRNKGLSYQLLDYAVIKCGARNLAVHKTNSIANTSLNNATSQESDYLKGAITETALFGLSKVFLI